MIKLSAKRKKWFTIPQDPTGETQIDFYHLLPGVISEVESACNRIVGREVKGKFGTEVDIDVDTRTKEIVKRAVIGWKGFEDENGKKMKCTDFNKLRVLKTFDWFFEEIEKFREELLAEEEESQEEAEKN